MKDTEAQIKEMAEIFDNWAEGYDEDAQQRFGGFYETVKEFLNEEVTKGVVLDVATGTGRFAINIADKIDGKVFGIDVSGKILDVARRKAQEKGLANVEFQKVAAEDMPFPNKCFDYVTCGFGMKYLADRDKSLKEMIRVMKERAKLIIIDKDPPIDTPSYTVNSSELRFLKEELKVAEMKELLEKYGLKEIVVQRIPYKEHNMAIITGSKI